MDKTLNENSHIKMGAIISYSAIIFNIIAGFVYTPWLVNEIGKSDYGLYTLAMSVITFFLMDFGISGSISRFISLYRAKEEEDKINNLIGLICKLYIYIDIVILIILTIIFLFIQNIFIELTYDEIEKLKVVFLIVGTFSLISFPFMPLNGIFTSYEKFIPLKLCDVVQKVLSIILVIISLIFGYGLYALVLVNALVNIFIIILKVIYLKRHTHIKINIRYKNKKLLKEILSFSIWMTVISIAQRLIINISPTILGILSGSSEISIFSIGVSIEGYVWTFANALNGLFLPKVTRIVLENDNKNSILELMIKVGRIQLIVIGIILVGFISMGQEFIMLWMGNDFNNSYYVAVFLVLPCIFTLTQEIAYNYLIAINEIKYRAYDFIGAAIISIILSLILTPKYGAIGAALGAGVGVFIGHVIFMNIIYYKVFKLNIIKFFKECHLKMIAPLGLTFLFGVLMQIYIPVESLIVFSFKAIILGVFYAICIWKLALNNYEKNLFKSIFNLAKSKIIISRSI